MMTKKEIINRIKDISERIPSRYIDEEAANGLLQEVDDMLRGILIDAGEDPDPGN